MTSNENKKYPELEINLKKIQSNVEVIVDQCSHHNVSVCGVVKGTNALYEVANVFVKGGCVQIGDSRIHHLRDLKNKGIDQPLLLTRIPMLSEISDLIEYVDISLNSELKTVKAINKFASIKNKLHKVILMCDLGDLREGMIDEEEILETALFIEDNLENIELYGIGTNLGCYGSIKPTVTNLNKLINIGEQIENKINRQLDVISGGATSTLSLIADHTLPTRINHLRIGEGMLLGRDLNELWNIDFKELYKDTYILNAEIVEIKKKPSYPIGEIFLDAFGETPSYDDIGIHTRAILAVGKQDFVYHDKIIPIDSTIKIIGSSSDHLILDMQNCIIDYKLGDIISFEMFYPPMLYLSGSSSVHKRFVYDF